MRIPLGYTVELGVRRKNDPHRYDFGAILLEGGGTFVFIDLKEAVAAARDYQRRNPQHDGFVRVSGLTLRLFPDERPMRVRVGGQTLTV